MKIDISELGGAAFEPNLLPEIVQGIVGHENFTINTTSEYIQIHGVGASFDAEILTALQAHVESGPAAWDAIKVSKQADPDSYDPVIKALALVMLLYHNHLRSWMRDFESEVAAATSLGDLKARMANLPDVPHVPKSTLKQDAEAILAPA